MKRSSPRDGQSLAEVLIAVAIGAVLIAAGVSLIVPALSSNAQAAKIQVATSLGKELIDSVRVWADGNWNNVLSLATGTANKYYLMTTSSPYTASGAGSGQTIVIGTSTYIRYFYLSDVYRDSSGNIVTSGGSYDPSTKLVTAVYNWLGGASTNTMSIYLVRSRNNVVAQNDWSGGPGQAGPATSTNNQFVSSTNIDYSTTTGSIYVAIPGY
jgi:hypothetical protein